MSALYQISTSTTLVEGVHSGSVPSSVLLDHGDFGLGTFENLEGSVGSKSSARPLKDLENPFQIRLESGAGLAGGCLIECWSELPAFFKANHDALAIISVP